MATTQTTTAVQQTSTFAPKAPTTISSSTSNPPEIRPRPYKDFLTPALHRRFTRAAALIFGACYLTSILVSPPSILWIWNPLSSTGIRAILLFIPCLAVFIVRVANMHVGKSAASSKAQSIWNVATSLRALHTTAWYMFSAWFFGEIYLWSQGPAANLGWVDPGKSYGNGLEELPMLNENPILLRSLWILLAVLQAGYHLARGEDRLPIPEKEGDEKKPVTVSKLPKMLQELVDKLPMLLHQLIWLLLPGLVSIVPLYWLLLQQPVWSIHASLARIFYSQLPTHSSPTGLQHKWRLIFQAVTSSILLGTLWELSSAAFTIYVCRPPLRKERPLTTEIKNDQGAVVSRSRDPNGSLLNGLKSRKEVPKAFAFWELCLICERFEERRKTIYTEVDRKDGSTWAQVSQLCLAELNAVQMRIKDALNPAAPTPQHQISSEQSQQPLGLPRILGANSVLNGDVVQRSNRNNVTKQIGDVAKSLGDSPQSSQAMQLRARKAIEWSTDQVISKRNQDRLNPTTLTNDANATISSFLSTPFGHPFIHSFRRQLRAVVFGSPQSSRTNLVHASQALCILCMHSLQEDDYGQVARTVPTILRTYTATLNAVANVMAQMQPHWTDVGFQDSQRRVADVEDVLVILKAGLEGVILAFGEYADSVGVTRKELREAREAVGKGLEMRKV